MQDTNFVPFLCPSCALAASPGAVDTPIIDGQFKTKEDADGARAMFSQMTPLGRIGRAEEIATAALFLASSDSSFATGIDLIVDGGVTQH